MLTCLALAMTGTAVLLSWMEPSGRGAGGQLAPSLAAMEAEQAVAPASLSPWAWARVKGDLSGRASASVLEREARCWWVALLPE